MRICYDMLQRDNQHDSASSLIVSHETSVCAEAG